MNRRELMQVLGCSAGGLVSVGHSAWALSFGSPSPSPVQKKLVVILLRGAIDGLNVVIPYGDANYYALRPTLAVPPPSQANGALDLDGYFGLHPALEPLQDLWRQRKLAFVHATGSPDATRSHFDAQDYMESGTPGKKTTPEGWMNRLLAVLPGSMTPTRGISVGAVIPRIFAGGVATTNIPAGTTAARTTWLDRPQVGAAFERLYQGDDKFSKLYQQGQVAHQEVMTSLEIDMKMADGAAPLPNGFPSDAAMLAKLMRNDPNVQLAFIDLGGWDTHANQGASSGQLANRLLPLGQGLTTLAQRLGSLFDDTVIVVMSEFGRTAHQNGNGGTDHGHGNVMWILGGSVAGGEVHGDWPGLGRDALYEGRDLAVTTDFRHVLVQMAEQHLGLSDAQLQQLFPSMPVRASELKIFRTS